ncbi:sigma-70 family RNA polymerase sigma factor [Streptomyces sp. S.PNR 29]|uniref:RNA polymerase sigma factor n=1 Tax=Streptomyces sp. S.PNR 29 TaxID=2973805 RepID=UPI0025B0557E|nr:sigma-70 family RNA polymerase sigma factor [Streptomyces sp. S.PNR 29]MDN0198478.1 sigma-70 family RNA polymerase sigma factor [Streptomyces sp. S.PNR 29]
MSSQPDTTAQTLAELIAAMPATFWRFHTRYDRAYYEYSRIHLGDDKAARHLVNMAFVHLATVWPEVERNPGGYAWTLLKQRVAAELALQGRTPSARETLAFTRAIRAATAPLLDSFRSSFRAAYGQQVAELEEGLELYWHMTRLSERHFDVLVLRDALGFDTKDTALIMGVSAATVRSTRRTAKDRLAAAMGCRFEPHSDE